MQSVLFSDGQLRTFADAFPVAKVTEISSPAVDDWLQGLKVGPVSRNNDRRVVGVLFNYGAARG